LIDSENSAGVVYYHNLGYWHVTRDTLITMEAGFAFPKNHFLFRIVDKVTASLLSTGVVQELREYYQGVCYPHSNIPESNDLPVFGFADLSFGFVVWITTVGVAILVLIVELSWFHGRRTAIKITKYSIALYFITGRLRRGFVM
jgi:hypothetical protein